MRNRRIKTAVSLVLILSMFLTVAICVPRVLAEGKEDQASNLLEELEFLQLVIEFVKANYVEEVDIQTLIDGAYKGVFEQLDPYSVYYTKEEYEDFDTQVNGTYEGIGIHITIRDDLVTVIAPIEGSPADKAGLKPGDKIIYVDDIDVRDYTLDQAASLMRGEPGTEVRLGIMREGEPGLLYFQIVRDRIEINTVKYEILEDNIGYIRITDFNEHVSKNVEDALEELDAKGITDIIIDLRNNPGGLLDEVVEIAENFIPEGPIVHIDRRNGERETHNSRLKELKYNLAVLVNEGSASASEIFAGAVQDTGAGVIIGTRTFGKGTVQTVLHLKNGGALKMTIARYLTPNERVIDGEGLTPDIIVENPYPAERYLDELAPIKGNRKPSRTVIGLDVLGAEQRLDVMGYEVGEVDGVFDGMLEEAVKQFQADNGLYSYGVLDLATQEKLQERFDEYIKQDDVDEQLQKAVEVLMNRQ